MIFVDFHECWNYLIEINHKLKEMQGIEIMNDIFTHIGLFLISNILNIYKAVNFNGKVLNNKGNTKTFSKCKLKMPGNSANFCSFKFRPNS